MWWCLVFYNDTWCLWLYMKYMFYMIYTRFFKLHLKMAYTIFQTTLQASVQVYKYNRCFNIKAVPRPFWDRWSDKLGVTKKSAASTGSCSLFRLPNGPAAVAVREKKWCIVLPRVPAADGKCCITLCDCSCQRTSGFILCCPSPDVMLESYKIVTKLGQDLPTH